MKRIRSILLTLAVAAGALALGTAALAQSGPKAEGATVRGAGGVVLGVVERVIYAPNGKPAQVLVRPKGPRPSGPHSLSYAGLSPVGDGFTTPLTKAEFDAMPSVEVEAN